MFDLRSFFLSCFLLTGLVLSGLAPPVSAQSTDRGGSVSVSGGERLAIGGLLQTDFYANRATAPDGFRVRTTRLRLGGTAQEFQYVIQTDLSSPSILLDAFGRFPLTDQMQVTAGLFKAPFGNEVLTSRPDILFAERSRAANVVPPGRQAGVMLSGSLIPDRLTASVGTFNGNRGFINDNNLLMYVGRLEGTVPVNAADLQVGTNVAYSVDDETDLSGLGRPDFTGRRLLFGADARLRAGRWLLEGELNTAQLDPEGTADTATPFGFYLAGGADIREGHQLLLRFDQYDRDLPAQPAPDDQVTLGYNYEASSMLRFQFNYQAAADELGDGFFTARLQIALR